MSRSTAAILLCLLVISTAALGQDVIVNRYGMSLKRINPGRFTMGSPVDEWRRRPQERHRVVDIKKPFYIGRTEVTQYQWRQIMESSPWSERTYTRDGPHDAATSISWIEAGEFCQRLGKIEGRHYRLPTDAEWEYACRAGTTTAFSFGGNRRKITEYGWVGENTFDVGNRYAHPVAKKKPNPWGLYDMHGNVWEWCLDRYSDAVAVEDSRLGSKRERDARVIRSGSWHGSADLCRCANRFRRRPDSKLNDLGFRVVLEVD